MASSARSVNRECESIMNEHLPMALRDAQKDGIEYFMGEDYEWKLEIDHASGFLEEAVGSPVCVFANNGYGDYLFFKKQPDSDRYQDIVYVYYHDGPEYKRINEPLDVLLGLVERPPSEDDYPKAVYTTGESVQVGDRVQVKIWLQFWKGWQEGVVAYVPGVSKMNPAYEYGGLKWVVIKFGDGLISPLVDPETGILKRVRFVTRGILR